MATDEEQFLRILKKSIRTLLKGDSGETFHFCISGPTEDATTLLLLAPAGLFSTRKKQFSKLTVRREVSSGVVVVDQSDGVLITLSLQKVAGVKATVFVPSTVKRWLKPIATGPLAFLKKVRIVRGKVKTGGGTPLEEASVEGGDEAVDGEAITLSEMEEALAALDRLFPELDSDGPLSETVGLERSVSVDDMASMSSAALLETDDAALARQEAKARFYFEETDDPSLKDLADRLAKIRTIKRKMQEPRWRDIELGITADELVDTFSLLDSAALIRSAVEEQTQVMITRDFRQFVRPDTAFRLDKTPVDPSEVPDRPVIEELEALYASHEGRLPPARTHAKLKAEWRDVATHGGLPDVDATANVFGKTGALMIDADAVEVPHIGMSDRDYPATLAFFGAKVVKTDAPMLLGGTTPVVGATFEFGEGYAEKFAKHAKGGGGLFVETHPFSHIFMPADAACDSKVLLGRLVDGGEIVFSSFNIPFGYAMVIRPNTIHGDGLTNGNLTVYLGDTPADTVACRTRDNSGPLQDIDMVEPEEVD